ncbi:MAG: DUF362 domain-containing protein [Candidatus Latescibacteria bacterium]|nr:DUF362 domain-containing protein [Candidatus Latescibacterota bacterium]
MKRREFLLTATGAAMTAAIAGDTLAQTAHRRDVSYEPNRPLESSGLSIRDGVKILKKGAKGNIPPVLREEILDNPNAVFIIYGGIKVDKDEKGNFKPVPDQMERFGNRVAELVFRKGTDKRGRTFIKPNIVGGLSRPNSVGNSHGGIVHPYFTCGMVDSLRDVGNTNIAIGARGALRHPQVVESGFQDLLDAHNLPLIEAHVQYFGDYKRSELVWHDNPEGMVQRRFCTYKPVFQKGTTFVNIAHAHTHKVGHTTLTLKNIQGVMPRGYGHICDSWTTLDMWRANLMKDFNRDFRSAIEKSYVSHGDMRYKYWDQGGFYKTYKDAGGYETFENALKTYSKSKGEARKKALEQCISIADTRIFWAEIWAQRMIDIDEVIPQPYVNMVEGVFTRGSSGTVLGDFVTVGRSMVAVDSITSWIMGHDPRELPYLRIANERGLGQNDIENIPLYILSEKGPKKVDYRSIERHRCGINNLGLSEQGPRFY